MPPVTVEQQRVEARSPRAFDVLPGGVPDVERLGGSTPSRAQVRWKISGAGLPVASIAETRTTPKNAESSSESSVGRCESQFEMIARARPRSVSRSRVGATSS